jgi:GMP synthase (glutamine-hydrolysing)
MSSFFILKTGTTFPSIVKEYGDFEDWILNSMENVEVKVINVEKNETLPEIKECLGVIITGSHVMVTDELPWSLRTEAFIRELVTAKVPLLGICYGHQLIAKSLGGSVDFHPKGMEIGTVNISTNNNAKNDALFHSFPKNFNAHVIHSQSVRTLPKNAILLASNDFETNHIFKVEPSTWAVQFHPEYNENIMKSYIHEVFKEKTEQNEQEDTILKNVKQTEDANKIIKIFIDIAKKTQESLVL